MIIHKITLVMVIVVQLTVLNLGAYDMTIEPNADNYGLSLCIMAACCVSVLVALMWLDSIRQLEESLRGINDN